MADELRLWTVTILSLTLVGCGVFGGKEEEGFSYDDLPDELKAGGRQTNAPPVVEGVVAVGEDPASRLEGLPSENEIVWTDPDDAKSSEASVGELLSIQKKDWLLSHSAAKNFSMLDGKPLLILFTDLPGPSSGGSPSAVGLERDLISRNDFSEWAAEHFIRLRLDYNVTGVSSTDSDKQQLAIQKRKFLDSLKKRYKVNGFPAMLVVAPDGSEVQRIRGYSGNPEFVWGLLRTAAKIADEKQFALETRLLKKGYRFWTGKNDLKTLARLVSYHEGNLILVGPNGNRIQTSASNLSREDREWLAEAKAESEKKRGAR